MKYLDTNSPFNQNNINKFQLSDVFDVFFSPFSSFNDEKIKIQVRIHENGNVQSHDQEKTKFDNKIITNSHANILEMTK